MLNQGRDVSGSFPKGRQIDREDNSSNVRIPCASGCQSLFTLPYDQGFQEQPYAAAGLTDAYARNFTPGDMMTFSLPARRFLEVVKNIPGSFLDPALSGP